VPALSAPVFGRAPTAALQQCSAGPQPGMGRKTLLNRGNRIGIFLFLRGSGLQSLCDDFRPEDFSFCFLATLALRPRRELCNT